MHRAHSAMSACIPVHDALYENAFWLKIIWWRHNNDLWVVDHYFRLNLYGASHLLSAYINAGLCLLRQATIVQRIRQITPGHAHFRYAGTPTTITSWHIVAQSLPVLEQRRLLVDRKSSAFLGRPEIGVYDVGNCQSKTFVQAKKP